MLSALSSLSFYCWSPWKTCLTYLVLSCQICVLVVPNFPHFITVVNHSDPGKTLQMFFMLCHSISRGLERLCWTLALFSWHTLWILKLVKTHSHSTMSNKFSLVRVCLFQKLISNTLLSYPRCVISCVFPLQAIIKSSAVKKTNLHCFTQLLPLSLMTGSTEIYWFNDKICNRTLA